MDDDEALRTLMLAILDLMGPLKMDRWEALTRMILMACEDDTDKAIGLVRATIDHFGKGPPGPPAAMEDHP